MRRLYDTAKELLLRVNAASGHIKKYVDADENRLLQDDVYIHILQIEKPYRFVLGRSGLAPMKENKGDVVQFGVRGETTTDPKVCVAFVSVVGFELQRLGEHVGYVLHVVSPQGTGFTFDYSTPIEPHHWVEGAADVKIAPVIFKENFL